MLSKGSKPRSTRTGRFVRRRRFDRNPLRRAADRAETIVLAVLLIVFAVGAPLAAVAASGWAHTTAQRAELAQSASRYLVPARVLSVAPAAAWPAGPSVNEVVQARWTAPDGAVVTDNIVIPDAVGSGAIIRVWTTRDGQPVSHPVTDAQVASSSEIGAIAAVAALALLLATIWLLARRSLDRRRMAAWDADWQATGPRWTTRA